MWYSVIDFVEVMGWHRICYIIMRLTFLQYKNCLDNKIKAVKSFAVVSAKQNLFKGGSQSWEVDFENIPVSAEQVERASVSEWFSRLAERDRIVLTELSEGRERKEIARDWDLTIGSFNNYMSRLIKQAKSSGVIR